MSMWVGRILSAVVVALLLVDSAINLFAPEIIQAEMEITGFPANLAPTLGVIMAICAILYAVPKTSFLGAILVTGFLGGAICTHFRLGEVFTAPQVICMLIGVAVWGGLYLRDPRLRQLMPIRV